MNSEGLLLQIFYESIEFLSIKNPSKWQVDRFLDQTMSWIQW